MESTSANVMIIDDEPQIRELSGRHLSAYGYRCETAPDAGTARRRLGQKRFDLILCDINLPDESGLHLAEYVKQAFPDTAIVMIPVIDDPGEAKLALDIGAFGYVVKPFTRNTLLINVENAVQRNRLEIEKKVYLDKLESLVHKRTRSLNAQLILLQNTTDAIPSPVFYKDTAGIFKGCNAAFESLIGIAIQAINEAGVYKFIQKPWEDADLKITIVRTLESIDLATERDRLIQKVKSRDAILKELEREHPGITKVKRDADGYMIID